MTKEQLATKQKSGVLNNALELAQVVEIEHKVAAMLNKMQMNQLVITVSTE